MGERTLLRSEGTGCRGVLGGPGHPEGRKDQWEMDCEESTASYPVNPTVGTELGAAPSSQKASACTMKIQPRAGAMVQCREGILLACGQPRFNSRTFHIIPRTLLPGVAQNEQNKFNPG